MLIVCMVIFRSQVGPRAREFWKYCRRVYASELLEVVLSELKMMYEVRTEVHVFPASLFVPTNRSR
jgi:hypothetical protein